MEWKIFQFQSTHIINKWKIPQSIEEIQRTNCIIPLDSSRFNINICLYTHPTT